MKRIFIITLVAATILTSCDRSKDNFDASGSFEAVETIISAEANGILTQFNITEGEALKAGQVIGYIDSTQLYLKKKQLLAQIDAILSKSPQVSTQLAALRTRLNHAESEYKRLENLHKADAATGKQVDDAAAQIAVIKKQVEAQRSSLNITSSSIRESTSPLRLQIAQTDDLLSKCTIINPVKGTVLTSYAEPKEMTVIGKPLYKIADLSTIILRAYITGDQFSKIKLNQKVKVMTDDGKGGLTNDEGIVEWISAKAEFTPKTVQTKDERANLVYAVKIRVKNDGHLKIGMYGEIKLN